MTDRKLRIALGAGARVTIEKKFTGALQAASYAALYSQLKVEPRSQAAAPANHVKAKMCDLIALAADLRLAPEIQKAEQRVRDESGIAQLRQEKERLERRVRKIERNLGYRVVSGLTNGVRNFVRTLRGKTS